MAESEILSRLRNLGDDIRPVRHDYFPATNQLCIVFKSLSKRDVVTLTPQELESVAAALREEPNDRSLARIIQAVQQDVANTLDYANSSAFKPPKPSLIS
jgi:hypothetical protein